VYKHKAYKECPVETEKEPNIESDIITWCVVGIPYKESDISDIKTWYCISIPAHIYIALLIVKECQYQSRHGPVKGPVKVYKYIHLYCSKCEYKFR